MSKENVQTVLALEKAWDSNELDGIEKYFTDDYLAHNAIPGMPATVEMFKTIHGMSLGAMPDRKIEILDAIDAGDKVIVRCLMTGTNNATGFPWFGAEANGGMVAVEYISIYRVEGNKVAEHWAVIDGFTLLAQIGAWAPPPMPEMPA
jgi:predicted ester cyclase